jgi:hypothetical protein
VGKTQGEGSGEAVRRWAADRQVIRLGVINLSTAGGKSDGGQQQTLIQEGIDAYFFPIPFE